MGGSNRWAERFGTRLDEVAAARAGSPQELRQRELSASTFFVWVGLGSSLLVCAAALLGGVGWWAPVLMAVNAVVFIWRWHRLRRPRVRRPPTDP